MKVFTDSTIKGRLGVNAIKTKKHLYDYLVFDSTNERNFAVELDMSTDVALYAKLPNGFYISTPVGNYNPDWAITFYKGKGKAYLFCS
jgi:type III restriction enzyme